MQITHPDDSSQALNFNHESVLVTSQAAGNSPCGLQSGPERTRQLEMPQHIRGELALVAPRITRERVSHYAGADDGGGLTAMVWKIMRWLFGGYYFLVGVLFGLTLLGLLPPHPLAISPRSAVFQQALAATGRVMPILIGTYIAGGAALFFARATPLGLAMLAPAVVMITLTDSVPAPRLLVWHALSRSSSSKRGVRSAGTQRTPPQHCLGSRVNPGSSCVFFNRKRRSSVAVANSENHSKTADHSSLIMTAIDSSSPSWAHGNGGRITWRCSPKM